MLGLVALVVVAPVAACAQPAHEGDARERDVAFERVGIDEFSSDGVSASLVDGVTYGGGAVVVGSVSGEVDGGPEDVAPIVLESSDGLTWGRAELGPLTGAASMLAVASGADGAVLAAGVVTGPRGRTEPALWRRDDGGWGDPATPDDLPRDLRVLPDGLAGGPAGFMVAGSRGSRYEIWTSTDGERWRRSASRLRVSPRMVVGEEFVAFVGAADPGVGTVDVLVSADGGELEKVERLGASRAVRIDDAAYVDGRYLAIGGDRESSTDDFSPATWLSDGPASWTDGPHLEDAPSEGSTQGTWARSVAAGPDGQLLVTSSVGDVWASGEDEEENEDELPAYPYELPSNRRSGGWIPLLPAGVPTLFTTDAILGAGDDGWDDRAAEVIPIPTRVVEVTSVAHGPGGFVAVGLQRPVDAEGESSREGLVWRSSDGQVWESLPTEPALAQTRLKDVAAYEGGYVAVGLSRDEDAPGDGRIFVSADGSGWDAVDGEGLHPPARGVHQLESVVAYQDGFIATGYGSDGTQIAPLILVSSDGTSVARADVPGPPVGDYITLGACAAGETALVVGTEQVDSVTAAAWRTHDGARWDRVPTDSPELSNLIACSMSAGGAIVAGGRVGVAGDVGVVPGVATDPSLALRPLPGGSFGEVVTAIGRVDDVPVVVGQGFNPGAGSGAPVWIATSEAALGWTRVTGDALDDLGIVGASGVAAGEGVVVVTGNTLTGGAVWVAPADDVLGR